MFKSKFWNPLFFVGLVVVFFAVQYSLMMPQKYDLNTQNLWLFEMHKCFLDQQIPCRWSPDLGGVYGYPLFNYQGPFPYYLGEGIYRIFLNYSLTIKILFVLSFVGIYCLSYWLIQLTNIKLKPFFQFLISLFGVLVSLIFLNTLNLVWAVMSLLLIIFLVIKHSKLHFRFLTPILALSLFMLVASIEWGIFVGTLIILFWVVKRIKEKQVVSAESLLFSLVISLLISGFYWIPMIMESGDVYSKTVMWGDFANNYQEEKSVLNYLPKYVTDPPLRPASSDYQVITGDTDIMNFQKGTNWTSFYAIVRSHTIIRLSQYYFPNWIIKTNGQEIKVDYNNSAGLMTIILGPGQYLVEGRLLDTPIRTIANYLSLFGLGMFLFLLLLQSSRIRKWFQYYIKVLVK